MKKLSLAIAATLMVAETIAFAAPTAPFPSTPLWTILGKAKTIQVTETTLSPTGSGQFRPTAIMTLKVSRPGFVHMEQTHPGAAKSAEPDLLLVSDGKILYEYSAAHKQFHKEDPPPGFTTTNMPGLGSLPTGAASVATTLDGRSMRLFTKKLNQVDHVVTFKSWIDAKTGLPFRQSILTTHDGVTQEMMRVMFSNWVLDQPIPAALFVFTPPVGATEEAPDEAK